MHVQDQVLQALAQFKPEDNFVSYGGNWYGETFGEICLYPLINTLEPSIVFGIGYCLTSTGWYPFGSIRAYGVDVHDMDIHANEFSEVVDAINKYWLEMQKV